MYGLSVGLSLDEDVVHGVLVDLSLSLSLVDDVVHGVLVGFSS